MCKTLCSSNRKVFLSSSQLWINVSQSLWWGWQAPQGKYILCSLRETTFVLFRLEQNCYEDSSLFLAIPLAIVIMPQSFCNISSRDLKGNKNHYSVILGFFLQLTSPFEPLMILLSQETPAPKSRKETVPQFLGRQFNFLFLFQCLILWTEKCTQLLHKYTLMSRITFLGCLAGQRSWDIWQPWIEMW